MYVIITCTCITTLNTHLIKKKQTISLTEEERIYLLMGGITTGWSERYVHEYTDPSGIGKGHHLTAGISTCCLMLFLLLIKISRLCASVLSASGC